MQEEVGKFHLGLASLGAVLDDDEEFVIRPKFGANFQPNLFGLADGPLTATGAASDVIAIKANIFEEC